MLSVAEKLMREGGYDAAQVGHLVKEAGVSVGSFYHHFGSKEGIIAALVRKFCDEGRADLEGLSFTGASFDQALKKLIQTGLKRFRANPELYRALASRIDKEPEIWEPFRQLRNDYERHSLAALQDHLAERGVADTELAIQRMTQVVLAVMTHTVLFGSGPTRLNGEDTDREMFELARSILLRDARRPEFREPAST